MTHEKFTYMRTTSNATRQRAAQRMLSQKTGGDVDQYSSEHTSSCQAKKPEPQCVY
ncbi:hypothetical protein [Acidithiobacillus ferrianus]|uniref:hypothetical protein n=1 Tax=Acidithiobacillus ferrianus TaxID=2678518 RepID=UPI0034E49583